MARKISNENTAEVSVDTTETSAKNIVDNKKTILSNNSKKVEPLHDTDEIEVMSLLPNVSYKDSRTNDVYEWDRVGHIEYMTVETLKNMWRNHKSYFRNMWLKPMDDRIINQFGLTSTFEKYEFLMDEDNYTSNNISAISEAISKTPNGLRYAIVNKIKNLIKEEKVNDIRVIRKLEKSLNLDLDSFE